MSIYGTQAPAAGSCGLAATHPINRLDNLDFPRPLTVEAEMATPFSEEECPMDSDGGHQSPEPEAD